MKDEPRVFTLDIKTLYSKGTTKKNSSSVAGRLLVEAIAAKNESIGSHAPCVRFRQEHHHVVVTAR
jgi:hypothetical protein